MNYEPAHINRANTQQNMGDNIGCDQQNPALFQQFQSIETKSGKGSEGTQKADEDQLLYLGCKSLFSFQAIKNQPKQKTTHQIDRQSAKGKGALETVPDPG